MELEINKLREKYLSGNLLDVCIPLVITVENNTHNVNWDNEIRDVETFPYPVASMVRDYKSSKDLDKCAHITRCLIGNYSINKMVLNEMHFHYFMSLYINEVLKDMTVKCGDLTGRKLTTLPFKELSGSGGCFEIRFILE